MTLDLGSVTSAAISVRYQNSIVQFNQSGNSEGWRQSPINWNPVSGSIDLTINWTLDEDVESLTPAPGLGIVVSNNGLTWKVPVPSAKQNDDFTVKTKKKDKIDPKIIITPQ